jgi:hypothetical protein
MLDVVLEVVKLMVTCHMLIAHMRTDVRFLHLA